MRSLLRRVTGLALCAALLGCGSGPVCVGTAGSCLDLRVAVRSDAMSATDSGNLTVWLLGTDLAGAPITVAGTVGSAASLPTELLIQPPSYVSAVQKISAQVLGASQELALFGITDLRWPLGTHIQATVTVAPPGLAFTRIADLVVGTNPSSVVVLDADRNGMPDLVVTSNDSGSSRHIVNLLLGGGDGTFGGAQQLAQMGAFSSISNLATADLNADGLADLAFADGFTSTIYLLLGNGNGTFLPAVPFASTVQQPGWLTARDLDGDGKIDLVVAGNNGSLAVIWNQGNASFSTTTYLTTGNAPRWALNQGFLAVADLNGDGRLDLVAAGVDFSGSVTTWINTGGRTFAPAATKTFLADFPVSVTVQDFDGDTLPDLAVMGRSQVITTQGYFYYLKGNGHGHFADPQQAPVLYDPRIAVGSDLNGDLVPDLVVTDLPTAGGGGGIHLALGNGAGGFSAVACASAVCQFPTTALAVVAQDLDGDNKVDLIVVTAGSTGSAGGVSILRNVSP